MANDELLRLLGSSGDPEQDLTATGSGSYRFVGKGRTFRCVLRVGGDVTGTLPTLDMRIQDDADGVGAGTTIGTFPQVIDEQVGYVATTTPRYEVPPEDPLEITVTTVRDYIRADYTIGGTGSPTFNDVSVELVPVRGVATKRSGVLL